MDQNVLNAIIKQGLATSSWKGGKLKSLSGGDINVAKLVVTDLEKKVFLKTNVADFAVKMFTAEGISLERMKEIVPDFVPKVYGYGEMSGRGGYLINEYLELSGKGNVSRDLGEKLSKLHVESVSPTGKFGFDGETFCGSTLLDNTWTKDWVEFFIERRLRAIVDEIARNHPRDGGIVELRQLTKKLEDAIPKLFTDLKEIKPSLVHGDLWSGNWGGVNGKAVIFDPASFYAHHEFELGIMKWFGDPGREFYQAYHEILPKTRLTDKRVELYKTWHLLNHWAIFGGGYAGSSLSSIKSLLKEMD